MFAKDTTYCGMLPVWYDAISFKTLALAENRLTLFVQFKSMRATQARAVTVRPLPLTNCEASCDQYSVSVRSGRVV